MKVVFTKSPTCNPFRLAYNEGDVAEVPAKLGKELIEAKFAIDEKDAKGEKDDENDSTEKATSKKSTEKATKK